MSYQVLARKWRPRNFADVLGQGHVLKALTNALDRDRLHHAYLFTGTRGVGKTTLARVFAKALNCELGVSSAPCGECSACREIDAGRCVDLIEVDAASRTKVDDTRELLDNVPYAPTSARYKVYLIDEVHMFSNHSFNALLKTLEEPPPHVKFLLATTDPKKLPVTVLSRCLQFNLTRLSVTQLAAHLEKVLRAEGIDYEAEALQLLAQAAEGSVRDCLSLLDQAIAHGEGTIQSEQVALMLGTVARDRVIALLEILAAGDARKLVGAVRELAAFSPDYAQVLAELLALLQRTAVVHALGEQAPEVEADARVCALADLIAADECQLFYQIALTGRRDLAIAPDPESGFEMVMLRMHAFRPAGMQNAEQPAAPGSAAPGSAAPGSAAPGPAAQSPAAQSPAAQSPAAQSPAAQSPAAQSPAAQSPAAQSPAAQSPAAQSPAAQSPAAQSPAAQSPAAPAPAQPAGRPAGRVASAVLDWTRAVDEIGAVGLVRELARNSALVEFDGRRVKLVVAPQFEKLAARRHVDALQRALASYLACEILVAVEVAQREGAQTPSQHWEAEAARRQREAEAEIDSDPNVRALRERFGAVIEEVSSR